ncbi:unnamed protein product [Gongylonema pulchrum]|uniref:VWFA domain-containing protein n=1 Tax=Gongylonema pulchrum TaxID=637853 RepID=A0A183D3R3_9BILA|nr:unnamed protein product [Gongylonema pulchrum]
MSNFRICHDFDGGIADTPVAAIRYSGPKRTDTLFHLRKHNSVDEAIKELRKAPLSSGTTRTGEAIRYAVGEFREKYGARENAKKMLIVFTDGYSQDDPSDAAREARSSGIEVKAVAVEDEDVPPDTEQIIAITGDPKVFLYLTYLIISPCQTTIIYGKSTIP